MKKKKKKKNKTEKGIVGVVPRPYLTLVPGSSPPLNVLGNSNPSSIQTPSLSEDSFLPKGIKYVKVKFISSFISIFDFDF